MAAASSAPGVVDYDCGPGQDSCPNAGTGLPGLDITGGTSVGAPLAAGIFAHLAGQVGCRLGDVHPALYALGDAQQSGGAQPFHDITSGNIDWKDPKGKTIVGFTAAPGFDLATGWGSLDVAKLIATWPGCTTADGGVSPVDAGAAALDAATAGPDVGAAALDAGAAGLDAATLKSDSGSTGARDAGQSPDAGAPKLDSGTAPAAVDSGGGASSSGCGCTAAEEAPSQWLGAGLLALGVIGLRRRRPLASVGADSR